MIMFLVPTHDDEPPVVLNRTGPAKKAWEELGPKQKKRRCQEVFNELKKSAAECGIEPVQLAGSLIHRYFFHI